VDAAKAHGDLAVAIRRKQQQHQSCITRIAHCQPKQLTYHSSYVYVAVSKHSPQVEILGEEFQLLVVVSCQACEGIYV